ncbi:glycosyltransferase family 4 protein [Fibrella sp. HMF5335]|uniref:Glycosyltransferase family 4 protein n=1 Tax=Fibrella rubiginis TaxID=2817060 RepID=A0A939GJF4_9BACT|nr:glycosyltransferase family 4 protein [Fibrella rubiginis]MBO0937890.1 glycosyltransferase family 4 protein [Fibrella rubiginis]
MPTVKPSITFMHPHCMLAGGATTVLLEVSKRLVLAGWPVHVVSVQSDPAIVREAAAAGVRFVDVGGPLSSSIWFWLQYPLMYWRVHRAARQIGSPVVVSEPFPANWWGWFYKKLNPAVQLVYVCHEPTAFIFEHAWINSIKPDYMRWGLKLLNPIFRQIEFALMPVTDRVVANSQYSERTIAQTFPRLDPARLRLVYCGIDHDTFYPRPHVVRQRQIVMVCTLNKFKRVDTVIRALALLRQQPGCGDVRLLIKGRGVEKDRLQQLATSLQLTDAVDLIDAFYDTTQLANLLCSSQVFVHAAHNEPFGLSPIEAMACGTPAVVTGTGGTAETVTNGVSGLYFNYESDQSLADQLQRLFTDEALWQRLSAGAINHAAQFNWALTHKVFSGVVEEVS